MTGWKSGERLAAPVAETRARSGADRASLYGEITSKIIAELEAGGVPWVQPRGSMPKNAVTGRPYSGINMLILWGAVIEHAFPSQSWLTFRQALNLGGNVRRGEHGTAVVYTDRFIPFTDGEGNLSSRAVFHDGQPVQCRDAVARCDRLIEHLVSGS